MKYTYILCLITLLISLTAKAAKIHQAIIDNDAACVEEVLNKEPRMIHAPDVAYGGWPPLHLAAFLGRMKIVKLLLAKGAKLNLTDIFGKTALDHAREKYHHDVVKFLATYTRS